MARNKIFWSLLIIVTETRVARSREPTCLTKNICPFNTYCSEQADYSVKCYPCHSDCDPSQGCDGPLSEQCRACKTGYTKQPGFSPCRASACPAGTYGNQCQNKCNCYKNDLCVQGRCTGGQCERGKTGLPMCLEACPAQTFGLDCRYICHCKDHQDCNKIQGDCPSYQCDEEWDGPGCQRKLPKLYFPPQVMYSKCNNITLRWFSFDETDDIGQGPIGLYKVMMKQMNGDIWLNPVNVTDPNIVKKAHIVSITSDLVPNMEYAFRVDIMATENDKLLKRTVPGEPSTAILHKCDKLPRLLTAPQAVFSSCKNLTVTWKEFQQFGDDGDGPISHYLVFLKANISDFVPAWTLANTVSSQNRVGLSYTVIITTGLLPNLAYYVRVDSVPLDTNNEPLNKYRDGREMRDPVLNQCALPCLVGTPCTIDTYCSEQADSSVLCSPCHGDCDLKQGCDGPLSEHCRGCKPGYTKTPGFFPCQRASSCAVGTYGNQCQNKCFCYNNDLCEQGKCNGGQCEPGRTGLPTCLQFCPKQTFGLDCSLLCHCKDNEDCDKVEGSCLSLQCHDDWDGLGCQRRLPKFLEPPKLLSFSCNNVTLGWSSFRENVDIGVGPIAQYNVMFKETESDRWYNPLNFSNLENTEYSAIITSGLTPDSTYQFRIDIVASDKDKLFVRRFVPGEMTSAIINKCPGYDFKTIVYAESISQNTRSSFLILLLLLLICILLLYIILENCKRKKHPPADVNVAKDAHDSNEPEIPEEPIIDNNENLLTNEVKEENEFNDEAIPSIVIESAEDVIL